MTYPRGTHYWLWFLLFGVIPILAVLDQQGNFDTENLWLFTVGGVGVLVGAKMLAPRWSRPFDLFIGVTFFAIGLLGILHNFGLDLVNENPHVPTGALSSMAFLGLSLSLRASLIHTVLGFLSFCFAIKSSSAVSSLSVNTADKSS